MEQFIGLVESVILPIVTVALGIYGWRANADKKKYKAELTSKEIENQNGWLDLYKRLHDDEAKRITEALAEIDELNKKLNRFENAFKKVYKCAHYDVCPIRVELSKFENNNRKSNGNTTRKTTGGQHKRNYNARDPTNSDSSEDSETEPPD